MSRLFVASALALTVACGGSSEPAPTAAEPALDRAAALAAADAHDGTVDHVVSECAVCGLAMPGDPAHAVSVEGYEVHLCSASCQTEFESHTDDTLRRVNGLTH